jgi:hypothetical protein
LLSDPGAKNKLTHMLTRFIGEEETTIAISSPLPEMDVRSMRRQKHTGRYFKITVELINYEMDGVLLDLGFIVNILPNISWD